MKEQTDLFGNVVLTDPLLRDKFIEPPFSVLDTKSGNWQKRKRQWLKIGIKSEIGRKSKTFGKFTPNAGKKDRFDKKAISTFDPALCEVLYHWFCPKNGNILDPFSGGSVRGIVANYLGYKYTGIDIRQEQIDSNREQALNILDINNQPNWYVGDSNDVLNDFINFPIENQPDIPKNKNVKTEDFYRKFDFVFSCPPYADLEVYSNLKGDISNMPYIEFMKAYEEIIAKSCKMLKSGGYACFVVGEVRDKKGNYIGFVPDTINAFRNCGMNYYNEGILLDQLGTASMRANGNMKSEKLVKVHQNILIFKK